MAITKAITKYGVVTGTAERNCTSFRGIPFAKAPVGELRFHAPQEPTAWVGERICDTFSPACIQPARGPGGGDGKRIEEDCLYLNIWTPANSAQEKLPVMFWIFGGGFTGGDGASREFNGKYLADHGVVVVTFNYRCGPMGFFSLPGWEGSGNFGLLDQAAALKWVYENIASFGGDPERILVYGQSAGGVSTRMAICSPLTRHMVRRAVVESGGGLNEADPVRPEKEFQQLCSDTLQELGWSEEDLFTRNAREVSEKLMQAGQAVLSRRESGRIVGVFQPYVDHVCLPDVPGVMIANGDYNTDADIIVGTVSGDDWMFSRKVQNVIPASLGGTRPFSLIPGFAWGRHQLKNGGPAIRTFYFEKEREEYKSGRMYRPGTVPHSSEIAYVFGTLVDKFNSLDPVDEMLSDAMMRYWTNFAKTGDPNLPDGDGLPRWPKFTEDCQMAMHMDNDGLRMENLLNDPAYVRLMNYTEEHPGMLMNLDDFE